MRTREKRKHQDKQGANLGNYEHEATLVGRWARPCSQSTRACCTGFGANTITNQGDWYSWPSTRKRSMMTSWSHSSNPPKAPKRPRPFL